MILALGCSPWPSTQWRNLFLLSCFIYYLWNIHDLEFQFRLVWLPVIFVFKVGLILASSSEELLEKAHFSSSSSRKKTQETYGLGCSRSSNPWSSFLAFSLLHFIAKVFIFLLCLLKNKWNSGVKSRCCTSNKKTKKKGSELHFLSVWLQHPVLAASHCGASLSWEHFATWRGQNFSTRPWDSLENLSLDFFNP